MRKSNSIMNLSGHRLLSDKEMLKTILEAQDIRNGIIIDSTATPMKARDLMIEQGVRSDENQFSCAIRRMREGD